MSTGQPGAARGRASPASTRLSTDWRVVAVVAFGLPGALFGVLPGSMVLLLWESLLTAGRQALAGDENSLQDFTAWMYRGGILSVADVGAALLGLGATYLAIRRPRWGAPLLLVAGLGVIGAIDGLVFVFNDNASQPILFPDELWPALTGGIAVLSAVAGILILLAALATFALAAQDKRLSGGPMTRRPAAAAVTERVSRPVKPASSQPVRRRWMFILGVIGVTVVALAFSDLWVEVPDKPALALSGHTGFVDSVAWAPDGQTLASASWHDMKLWDMASGRQLQTLSGHTGGVNSVAWAPDGRTLASSEDRTVKLWDVASGQTLRTIHAHTDSVNSVAWAPDGQTLASGGKDRTVRVWRVTELR